MSRTTQLTQIKPRDRRGERGSVLVFSTIGMLSLLLAAGLAVDVSHLYTAKAELQNAADAAAIAGAYQLNSTAGGIKQAVAEATTVMNKYDFKNDVTISASNVTFAANLNDTYMSAASAEASATTIRFVKVTIPPKPVNVTFAALVIDRTQNLSATATAGMSVGLTMNKFYTAFAFLESPTAPLGRGLVHTLSAKAANVNTPNSYRLLAGPGGDSLLNGTIHAYAYANGTYDVANLNEADACRRARLGVNTRFGDYSSHPNGNPTSAPPDT
ncbi:MAG: pilus assembly protein TadG-related protein, partial [Pyrinomonadaceae bacterium]